MGYIFIVAGAVILLTGHSTTRSAEARRWAPLIFMFLAVTGAQFLLYSAGVTSRAAVVATTAVALGAVVLWSMAGWIAGRRGK